MLQISFKIENVDLEAEMNRWLIILQDQDATISSASEFARRMLQDNLVSRVLEREGQVYRAERVTALRAEAMPTQAK